LKLLRELDVDLAKDAKKKLPSEQFRRLLFPLMFARHLWVSPSPPQSLQRLSLPRSKTLQSAVSPTWSRAVRKTESLLRP